MRALLLLFASILLSQSAGTGDPPAPTDEVPAEMQELLLMMDLLEQYGDALDAEDEGGNESGQEDENADDREGGKQGGKQGGEADDREDERNPAKPGGDHSG